MSRVAVSVRVFTSVTVTRVILKDYCNRSLRLVHNKQRRYRGIQVL